MKSDNQTWLPTYNKKTIYRKPGLYKDYNDGHIYVSRKAVEKSAYDTLTKYDEIRQPNVVTKLYNKKTILTLILKLIS